MGEVVAGELTRDGEWWAGECVVKPHSGNMSSVDLDYYISLAKAASFCSKDVRRAIRLKLEDGRMVINWKNCSFIANHHTDGYRRSFAVGEPTSRGSFQRHWIRQGGYFIDPEAMVDPTCDKKLYAIRCMEIAKPDDTRQWVASS